MTDSNSSTATIETADKNSWSDEPIRLPSTSGQTETIADEVQRWLGLQGIGFGPSTPPQPNVNATRVVEGNDAQWSSNSDRVIGLRKWAGQIESINDGLMTIHLYPADHDGPAMIADFNIALLGSSGSAVRPGAVVYLTTRTVLSHFGHVEGMTQLRLRRPRRWTKAELDEINRRSRARAKKLADHANRSAR